MSRLYVQLNGDLWLTFSEFTGGKSKYKTSLESFEDKRREEKRRGEKRAKGNIWSKIKSYPLSGCFYLVVVVVV